MKIRMTAERHIAELELEIRLMDAKHEVKLIEAEKIEQRAAWLREDLAEIKGQQVVEVVEAAEEVQEEFKMVSEPAEIEAAPKEEVRSKVPEQVVAEVAKAAAEVKPEPKPAPKPEPVLSNKEIEQRVAESMRTMQRITTAQRSPYRELNKVTAEPEIKPEEEKHIAVSSIDPEAKAAAHAAKAALERKPVRKPTTVQAVKAMEHSISREEIDKIITTPAEREHIYDLDEAGTQTYRYFLSLIPRTAGKTADQLQAAGYVQSKEFAEFSKSYVAAHINCGKGFCKAPDIVWIDSALAG